MRKNFERFCLIGFALGFLILYLAFPPRANGTTLINDPQYPFTATQMSQMQKWVDVASKRVSTVPGTIVLSHEGCPGTIEPGCAGDHFIALSVFDRFTLMHELGHEDEYFDGPGSPILGADFGYANIGWGTAKIDTLSQLMHIAATPFFGDMGTSRVLSEVGADAYAMCATRPGAQHWWGHSGKNDTTFYSTPTPYDFEAGPKSYKRICSALKA